MTRASRITTPILPGHRGAMRPLSDRDERSLSTRTDDQVITAILDSLADGPLEKSRLRELLHEDERRLSTILKGLRHAGRVKLIGTGSSRWRWALATWQAPPPVPRGISVNTVIHTPKPRPSSSSSWWTAHAGRKADRGAFRNEVAARERERSRDV